MPENQTQTVTSLPEAPVEKAPNRLQVFTKNHPKITKVAAVTCGATAVLGVVHFARTVHANKDHLASAADEAKAALGDLAASTSPTTDTDA